MDLRTAKRLHDALVAAIRIQKFASRRSFEEYAKDGYLRSAVERQLEVLSEALSVAEGKDPGLRGRFPEISEIAGPVPPTHPGTGPASTGHGADILA